MRGVGEVYKKQGEEEFDGGELNTGGDLTEHTAGDLKESEGARQKKLNETKDAEFRETTAEFSQLDEVSTACPPICPVPVVQTRKRRKPYEYTEGSSLLQN